MEIIENPVEDSQFLRLLCEKVGSETEIAIDTEFTRIRTYRPQLELIQLASKNLLFCVDVSRCQDISPLLNLLRSSFVTVVMHSASQDLEILREYDAVPNRIFDTQIAARLCGSERVSYKDVVHETTGTELSKSLTKSNWSKRPLSEQQIRYALDDVRYLIRVRCVFGERLKTMGREAWLKEECDRLVESYRREMSDLDIYRSFHQAADLTVADQHRVRRLLLWREYRAQKLDRPRQWIVSDTDILKMVRMHPKSEDQLSGIIGLRKKSSASWLREILEILKSPSDCTSGPVWIAQQPLNSEEKDTYRKIMQIARKLANEYRLSTDLICTSKEVRAIVRGKREGRIFSGWRKEIIANAIADLLSETRSV